MAALMSTEKPRRLGKSWNHFVQRCKQYPFSSYKILVGNQEYRAKVLPKRSHLKGTAVFQPCPRSLTICRWEPQTTYLRSQDHSPSLGVHSALPTFSLCSATEFSLAWQAQKGHGDGGGGGKKKKPPPFYPFQRMPRRLTKLCTGVQYVAPFINLLLRPNSYHF